MPARYDPNAKTKVGIGAPLQPAAQTLNGNHAALEQKFRGMTTEAIHQESIANGQGVDSAHAKEISRRANIGSAGYDPVSTADTARVNAQSAVTSSEVQENGKALAEKSKATSAANAKVKYPTTALPNYAPSSNPQMTQARPVVFGDKFDATAADTAKYQQGIGKPSALLNNSEVFVGTSDGRVVAPGQQAPVQRLSQSGIGSGMSAEGKAVLEGMKAPTTAVNSTIPVGQAKPTLVQSAVMGVKNAAADMPGTMKAVGGKVTKGGIAGGVLAAADVANSQVKLNDQTTGIERATQGVEDVSKAAGATAGAIAGATGGAALGAMTGPFSPIAAPVLGVVGGIGGGALGYMAPAYAAKKGRELTDYLSGGKGEDAGTPLEQQQAAGTADPGLLAPLDKFIANEKRDVVSKDPQALTAQTAEAINESGTQGAIAQQTGGTNAAVNSGGIGGSGSMSDSQGNTVTWDPEKQAFSGRLSAKDDGKARLNSPGGPVNSAGQMFQPQTAGIGASARSQPANEGGGRVTIIKDSANDPYQKILNDPNVSDMVKAKLQLRMDVMNNQKAQSELASRRQDYEQQQGDAILGMRQQESGIDTQTKKLSLDQALQVSDLRKQLATETDPVIRQQLSDQYDVLMNNTGKYQVAQAETGEIDPNTLTPIKKSVIVNARTGGIQEIKTGKQVDAGVQVDEAGQRWKQNGNGGWTRVP